MKSKYANLDMLRTFAVLSVVAQHLWHWLVNFGLATYSDAINQILGNLSFTGVMFFFVHTCLVLMLSMSRSPTHHLTREFLVRRAFRIYPLCWFTVVVALLTGLTDHPEANLHLLGWKGLAANLLLIQNATRSFPSVVGPLWSLPWEVQMYLVLPAFFLLLRRPKGMVLVFLLWLGASILAIGGTYPSLPRMFHATVFPPMFIAGMVAFKLLQKSPKRDSANRLPGWIWPIFVLSLFVLKDKLAGPHTFETQIGATVNAGICLVLALGIAGFRELSCRWITYPAQQIAKYSYGIYLLHVPALILVLRYFPRMGLVATTAVFLIVTAALSVISYHLLEDPLIQLGKKLAVAHGPQLSKGAAVAIEDVNTAQPEASFEEVEYVAVTKGN